MLEFLDNHVIGHFNIACLVAHELPNRYSIVRGARGLFHVVGIDGHDNKAVRVLTDALAYLVVGDITDLYRYSVLITQDGIDVGHGIFFR